MTPRITGPVAGMPPSPVTWISRAALAPATIAPVAQPVDATLVSQIRVGAIAWYWYPVVAAAVPTQPFASRRTLILPAAAYTHTAVPGPLGPGPRATITRFASIALATRLSVEILGAAHVPADDVG